jgi:PHD/YefM family antitoxin component YafN of YafNO toxin-antitoxin module
MDRFIVTRRGKPVMTILSPEDFEGLIETIEILSDRTAAKRIRRSLAEARQGKTRSLEDIRRRLERVSD